MMSLLFCIIGFTVARVLNSGGIGYDMWQFWVVVACLLASIFITGVAAERHFK